MTTTKKKQLVEKTRSSIKLHKDYIKAKVRLTAAKDELFAAENAFNKAGQELFFTKPR